MAVVNKAKFSINSSASSNNGYAAVANEVLTITLESPTDVSSVRYQLFDPYDLDTPLATLSAPDLTFAGGVHSITLTPASLSAVVTMIASLTGTHSWNLRATAQVTGGSHVFERIIALKNGRPRKPIPAETTQWSTRGWADDWAELIDLGAGSGGGGGGGAGSSPPPVELVLTTTDTLSGLAARDGFTPVAGTRVLYAVVGASAGIYSAASGAWSRVGDMDIDAEVVIGSTVYVKSGTLGAGTWWQLASGATLAAVKTYKQILGNPDTVIGQQGSVTRLGHDVRAGTKKIESGSNYIDVVLVAGAGATVIWSMDCGALGFAGKALFGAAANIFQRWPIDDKSVWATSATHWRYETGTPIKIEDRSQQTLDGATGANNYVALSWVLSGTVIQLKANNLRATDCVGYGIINFSVGDTV